MKTLSFLLVFSWILCSFASAQGPNLTLTSPVFKDNQNIPSEYTCVGSDINPPLSIKHVPTYTKSLILMLHDPDAAAGDWTHWMVYNIKPQTKSIAKNSIPGYELINDFNKFHYGGPCPSDEKPHHYVFELFAIDTIYTPNENGSVQGLLQKIQGHILDKTRLTGIYKSP